MVEIYIWLMVIGEDEKKMRSQDVEIEVRRYQRILWNSLEEANIKEMSLELLKAVVMLVPYQRCSNDVACHD